MIDTQTAEAVAPPLAGFVGKGRTRRVECSWIEPEEGHERLWADVRSDLPLGLVHSIQLTDVSYQAMWERIAPFVVAWNALAYDIETGARIPAPPPAEVGPAAFEWVDPLISDWLAFELKMTYRSIVADPKDSSASAPSPSSASGDVSASSAPAKSGRKSRATSR